MKLIASITIITIIIHTGCKNEEQKGNVMANFIENYDQSIQKDSIQRFIIVPMYGCIGCQDEMMSIWSQDEKDNYKLLTSNLRMLDDNYRKWKDLKSRIFVDSSGKLDRIPFQFGDFNLVTVKSGKIIDNLPVMPDANRDSVISQFALIDYQ